MQQNWSVQLGHILYAFPSFSLIPRVLHKIVQNQVQTMTLVVPVWQTQTWYPRLHHTSHAKFTATCIKGGSTVSVKENIKVSGLESFR